jgi:hypothetical protein
MSPVFLTGKTTDLARYEVHGKGKEQPSHHGNQKVFKDSVKFILH